METPLLCQIIIHPSGSQEEDTVQTPKLMGDVTTSYVLFVLLFEMPESFNNKMIGNIRLWANKAI